MIKLCSSTYSCVARGLIFGDLSVKALMDGRKTQSRRLARELASGGYKQRYGKPGDLLWCREAWRTEELEQTHVDGIRYRADGAFVPIDDDQEAAQLWMAAYDNGRYLNAWRTPLFMRRWMARVTLEVKDVRLERLQDISDDDALAEGVTMWDGADDDPVFAEPRAAYAHAWNSINGKTAPWSSNPMVWRIAFERIV